MASLGDEPVAGPGLGVNQRVPILALQLGSRVAIANADAEDALDRLARGSSPESTLRRIEAIAACREALDRNVAPLLAVEAMTMALRAG